MLGMLLHSVLPQEHLIDDSKDVVKMGMGLVATMCALVLGLLVSTANNSYEAQSAEMTEVCAKIVLLDRILSHYGPEAKETRDAIRSAVIHSLGRMSSKDTGMTPDQGAEVVFDKIHELVPEDDGQRLLKAHAESLIIDLAKTRWLQFEQGSRSVSMPLLVTLVFWLTTLFISFGLLVRRNGTVVSTLLVSALCVSSAIFVILELYSPYAGTGLVRISSAPLRAALTQLDK
jgi:hypothetical protein